MSQCSQYDVEKRPYNSLRRKTSDKVLKEHSENEGMNVMQNDNGYS